MAEYDADCRAVIDFLKKDSWVCPDKIGTLGFCIGGHLSFRAAFQNEIKVCACCYPTGIPSGKLGKEVADTIGLLSQIKGEMLMVFGTLDPHIPELDRQTLIKALENANVSHKVLMYEAEHTFMRDDGYRYDPAAATSAWSEILAVFARLK